ncbi:MAG: transposase family protein [Oscillospiraceae bacterium]|nr:transposase family protein [Oscillospiraceae bacterium]
MNSPRHDLVDVTECPIERPNKQRQWYSGKKKKHTIKTQFVVNKGTEEIICVAENRGNPQEQRNAIVYARILSAESSILKHGFSFRGGLL